MKPHVFALGQILFLSQINNLHVLLLNSFLLLQDLAGLVCDLVVELSPYLFEILFMKREFKLQLLHMFSQFSFLRLILLSDGADQALILRSKGCLVILMLLLQCSNHVRVVNTHALNQVLVVPLCPRFTLHAIVHLLLLSIVISGQHFNAVLVSLIIQP